MRNYITAALIFVLTVSYLPAQDKNRLLKPEKTVNGKTSGLDVVQVLPEDASLISVGAAAVRATPKISGLWKDYWSPEQAFIIYKPGEAALLISSIKPSDTAFQSLDPASLPRELRGRAYLQRGTLSGLTSAYNTHYPVGNRFVFAVSLGNSYDTLALLFHEGFHEFQIGRKQFARTIGASKNEIGEEIRPDSYVISNPEFVALMEIERRILAYAIRSISYKNVSMLLRQYLSVRRKRRQLLPQEIQDSELNIERKEGTAALVGYEGASLSLNQDINIPPEQLEISFSEYKEIPKDTPYGLFRMHAYRTGSAIAWLLTRLGINWRQRSQRGAHFESLLSEAVKFNQHENLAAEVALKAFGYASALEKAKAWKSNLPPEITVADFYKTGKVKLVIEFSFAGREFPEIKNTGTGLPAMPEENISIQLGSQLFTINHPQVSLESEKHPQMDDLRKAPKLFSYTIMLNGFPEIEGYQPGKSQVLWSRGGSIKGEGLKLKIEKPATITIAGDTVTVSLGEL